MLPSVNDYAWARRDTNRERALARELRQNDEAMRLEFLQTLAYAHPSVALELATRCLEKRASFEALLYQGLDEADSSGLRFWLACVLPRLGFQRVVSILKSRQTTHSDKVSQAAYWLSTFSSDPGYSREAVESLQSDG